MGAIYFHQQLNYGICLDWLCNFVQSYLVTESLFEIVNNLYIVDGDNFSFKFLIHQDPVNKHKYFCLWKALKNAIMVTLSLSHLTPTLQKDIGTVNIGTISMISGPPPIPLVVGTYKPKIRWSNLEVVGSFFCTLVKKI